MDNAREKEKVLPSDTSGLIEYLKEMYPPPSPEDLIKLSLESIRSEGAIQCLIQTLDYKWKEQQKDFNGES